MTSLPLSARLMLLTFTLTACATQSAVPLPPAAPAGNTAQTVQVLSLTELSGEWGRALPDDTHFTSRFIRTAEELRQAAQGNGATLVYADASRLATDNGAQRALLLAAKDAGLPVLIEAGAGGERTLQSVTMNAFHFEGKQPSYLVQPITGTDQGLAVTALDAPSQANTAVRSTGTSVSSATDLTWLRRVLTREDKVDSPAPSLQALTIPPMVYLQRTWGGGEAFYIMNRGDEAKIADCSTTTPCTDYTYSTPNVTFGTPSFKSPKWYGSWVVCGGTEIDLNNSCGASYTNTTINTTGSSNTLGFAIGAEVNGEASIGAAYNPFTLFSEWKAKLAIKGEIRYDHTWTKSSTSMYSVTDNVSIKQGYRARFGQGDYGLNYNTGLKGRHERNTSMVAANFTLAPHCTIDYNDWMPAFTLTCGLPYNANFLGPVESGTLKSFGAKVWAICKNSDLACISNFNAADKYDMPL